MKLSKKNKIITLILIVCVILTSYVYANQSDFIIKLDEIIGKIEVLTFNNKSIISNAIEYQKNIYININEISKLLDKEIIYNNSTDNIEFKNRINTTKGSYSGEIKIDGKGKFTWINGTTYEGDWNSGKVEGNGNIKYSNADNFVGDYLNNKRNKEGKYTWANGETYSGTWKDDMMSGKGTYTFKNGDKYEGNWLNNKMEGDGKYIFKNGTVLSGIWKNNKYTITSIGKGSTKAEVLIIMGVPNSKYESTTFSYWDYGSSTIYFDKDSKVTSWYNAGNLKVKE